jgi:hypothetical protein
MRAAMRSNLFQQADLFDALSGTRGSDVENAGVATVAKKTAKKSGNDKNKPIIATMRGSLEFKAFLEMAAKKDRLSVADFLERAAVRYARELGIQEEPPER